MERIRNSPAFVHESVRFEGGGVMIRDPQTYCGLYATAIGAESILVDDNVRPHRANQADRTHLGQFGELQKIIITAAGKRSSTGVGENTPVPY
ncbi:hypothetical protein HNY73_010030 [Argiope bruennichi]|uniref:Uncharacterized protein n=1 Tax=Argiope bruennichi TaxID=94029 RepID=A0A8T0F0I8_ARGBR|nr:hypothetical protein HNY73_010030 [Argiope bruennichi]